MTVEIGTTDDLARLAQYTTLRDAPRNTMAHGVYPNALAALAQYETLHVATVGAVLPHVQTMIAAMLTIVGTMRAIEKAAPGTFGIQLPEAPVEVIV